VPNAADPAYAMTGGGGSGRLPYWAVTSQVMNEVMHCAAFPASADGSRTVAYFIRALEVGATGYIGDLGTSGLLSVSNFSATTTVQQFNGSAANALTIDAGADHLLLAMFAGASSSQTIDCVVTADGGNPGSTLSSGGISVSGSLGANSEEALYYGFVSWPYVFDSTETTNMCSYWTIEKN
jgi:hypothetical protein